MRIGAALNCSAQPSIFHRKNYFYPDMPKDYQISQYDEPINVDGCLELPDGVARRHRTGAHGRGHGQDDPCRRRRPHPRGRPLARRLQPRRRAARRDRLPPDIRSAAQARAYVDELRAILVATGASDGRMEEGSLRVDANVSVRPAGATEFGTRCEIKNLNSLRSLERAIDYEVAAPDRAARIRRASGAGDPALGRGLTASTHSLRSKEEANDYRYFPEPDLDAARTGRAVVGGSSRGCGPHAGRTPPPSLGDRQPQR